MSCEGIGNTWRVEGQSELRNSVYISSQLWVAWAPLLYTTFFEKPTPTFWTMLDVSACATLGPVHLHWNFKT